MIKKLFFFGLSVLLLYACTSDDEVAYEDDVVVYDVGGTSEETGDYAVVEGFVEGMDAVLTAEGYICLFGVEQNDTTEGGCRRVIYLSQADYSTGAVDTDDDMCVVLDTLGMPYIVAMRGYTILFTNMTTATFDCLIMEDGQEPVELTNLPTPTTSETCGVTGVSTRAAADSGDVPLYGLDDLIDDIGRVQAMEALITATTTREMWSAALGAIASALSGEAGLTLGTISGSLVGKLSGAYLGLAGYLWEKNKEFISKHLGAWKISIESVEQTTVRTITVTYSVEGLNDDCEGQPMAHLLCQNMDTRKYLPTVELGRVVNGTYTYTMTNIEPGEYGIEMRMYDNCHTATNISVMTYPQVKVSVYDLGINRYVVDNVLYSDGKVHFDIDVYLEGNDDNLQDVKEYGFYVKFANSIDYHSVATIKGDLSQMPITLDLDIEKDGFFEKDYSAFRTEATDYYIGAYVVDKTGGIQYFDEQPLTGLVYDAKPKVTFTSAEIMYTELHDDDDYDYYTYYSFCCDIEGGFWISYLQHTTDSHWVSGWGPQYVSSDGELDFYGLYKYSNSSTDHPYFTIYLDDGQVMTSENRLEFILCGEGSTVSVKSSLTLSASLSSAVDSGTLSPVGVCSGPVEIVKRPAKRRP